MPVAQGEQDKSEAAAGSTAASRLAAKRAAKAAAKAAQRATNPIPNEVAQSVTVARSFYGTHARTLWLTVAVAAVGGLAWIGISHFMGKQGAEASESLHVGVTVANAPIVAEGEEAPEDAPETFSSAKARAEKARAEYDKTIKSFSGSDAVGWAQLGQAQALEQLGKHGEAQQQYQKALAADDQGGILQMLALQGIAFSLEAEKKHADAAARFAQISALADGAYKPVGEYHRARMLLAQNKPKDAASVLEALVKAERARPTDAGERWKSVLEDAQTRLDELAVQLDQPKLRAEPSGGGLPQNIIEALRGQMGAGKGEPGLSEDILRQLEQQVDTSGGAPPTAPAAPVAPKGEPK
jgi:tetratricopeptide (TPR) repeat protein